MRGPDRFRLDARGQTHTFEGVVAALMILGAIIFALQATAVTPLTASTANQLVEEQNRFLASDILDTANQQQAITSTLLYYNTTNETFVGADQRIGHYSKAPPTRFGALISTVFDTRNIVYNVYVSYQTTNGNTVTERVVYQGQPSDNAAADSRSVVLYDDMEITDPNNDKTLEQDSGFYIPDASPGSDVYNVVEVKIVVWKI